MRVRKNVLAAVGAAAVLSCLLLAFAVTRYRQVGPAVSFETWPEEQSTDTQPLAAEQQQWRVPYADDLDGGWGVGGYGSGESLNYADFVQSTPGANNGQQAALEQTEEETQAGVPGGVERQNE
ncbi:MAG: hypothetical protein ACAI38_12310 [Myxococcota bacterium]